jgi:hypothetical protein
MYIMLKSQSSTSGVMGKFLSNKMSLVGYNFMLNFVY